MTLTSKFNQIALAAALAASGGAFADTVNLTGFTYDPASPLTVAVPGYSGPAGQFSGTLNGASFVTYCTDLTQSFSFDVNYNDYSVVDGVAAWGASRSQALDKAMSAVIANGWPSDAAASAVVQAAVWEILYETSGSYGFGSGTFTATSADPIVQSSLNSVDPWVWTWLPSVAVTVHASQLYSGQHQDFLTLTPVPEPGTYAMLLAGLGAIGFVARRRAPRA